MKKHPQTLCYAILYDAGNAHPVGLLEQHLELSVSQPHDNGGKQDVGYAAASLSPVTGTPRRQAAGPAGHHPTPQSAWHALAHSQTQQTTGHVWSHPFALVTSILARRKKWKLNGKNPTSLSLPQPRPRTKTWSCQPGLRQYFCLYRAPPLRAGAPVPTATGQTNTYSTHLPCHQTTKA